MLSGTADSCFTACSCRGQQLRITYCTLSITLVLLLTCAGGYGGGGYGDGGYNQGGEWLEDIAVAAALAWQPAKLYRAVRLALLGLGSIVISRTAARGALWSILTGRLFFACKQAERCVPVLCACACRTFSLCSSVMLTRCLLLLLLPCPCCCSCCRLRWRPGWRLRWRWLRRWPRR